MDIGQTIELEIADIGFGGDGVGRCADGRAVFVPFCAVGDRLEVAIVHVARRFARGRIHRILESGPGRTEPQCPHYERCGGCRYQHLTADCQLEVKRAQLEALLRRIGKLDELPEMEPVFRAPAPYGYRNKLKLEPVGEPFETSRGMALGYGFCEVDNETFFRLDACPLAAEPLNKLIRKVRRTNWAQQNAKRPHPGSLTLRLTAEGTTHFFFRNAPTRVPWLHEQLMGRAVHVPLGSFWQTNPPVADALAETARRWYEEAPTANLVDAYAGVGTFSLAIGNGPQLRVLIERDEQAVEAAKLNHAEWALAPCQFMPGAAEKLLPAALDRFCSQGRDTTVVLDPPRSGCPDRLLQRLAKSSVPRIIYVSCDPAHLARDVATLRNEGSFRLEHLGLFDMFPQTAHFETLALLTR